MSLIHGNLPDAEARRYGRAEFRAEQRRQDEDARHKRRMADRERQRKTRRQQRRERQQARRQRWKAIHGAITEHMPLPGLPVVAVSLAMGWGGQVEAALALGMGIFALGIPVLTEGMTLTLAGLTAYAIHQRRPHGWLLACTWISGVVAATFNAGGHLIEDSSPDGMYRAGAYAGGSLAALILWAVVMRAKRAEISKTRAEEVARWRRLRRRHPFLTRRARRQADVTGQDLHDAWGSVWTRMHGAPPGEPTIAEIRAEHRAAYRRSRAEDWDGRRWRRGHDRRRDLPVPETPVTEPPAEAELEEPVKTVESVPPVPAPEAVTVPVPERRGALWVPGPPRGWGTHAVPLSAATGALDRAPETVTPRFQQGQDAVPGHSIEAAEPAPTEAREVSGDASSEAAPSGDEDTRAPAAERVRDAVADSRLETVREMVAAVAEAGGDLTRKPSVRETRTRLSCRSGTAKGLLQQVLAEHGVTRNGGGRAPAALQRGGAAGSHIQTLTKGLRS
jgi:hypothetical protein